MAYDFYIRKKQDLIEAVQEYGIVPYFQSTAIHRFCFRIAGTIPGNGKGR